MKEIKEEKEVGNFMSKKERKGPNTKGDKENQEQ